MKNLHQITRPLAILLFVIPMAILGNDWENHRDELLKQAEEEFNKALQDKVQPEKLARDNGFPWPIKPPAKLKLVIRTEVLTEAQELADKEFSQDYENNEIQKIREQYSLFKLDDVITVETKLRLSDVITGKLVAYNKEYAKIGSRIINMSDMPEHVRDRFFKTPCLQLQEKKINDFKRKIKAKRAAFINEKDTELLPKALLDNGYYPLNDDSTDTNYTSLDNWVSIKDLFDKKLEEAQNAVSEELHDEIVARKMKENGYVYNAIQGTWIPAEQPKSKNKKGTFQKLKDIFGN